MGPREHWPDQPRPSDAVLVFKEVLFALPEFTLNDERSVKPLVELKDPAPRPGIHALRLNYTLKPEVEYQWSIAAVPDPNQRANDTISSGTLNGFKPHRLPIN
ncbi:MAG: hypothetical protein R3F44_09625 [Candidatus Competibacteraceae bacterium]